MWVHWNGPPRAIIVLPRLLHSTFCDRWPRNRWEKNVLFVNSLRLGRVYQSLFTMTAPSFKLRGSDSSYCEREKKNKKNSREIYFHSKRGECVDCFSISRKDVLPPTIIYRRIFGDERFVKARRHGMGSIVFCNFFFLISYFIFKNAFSLFFSYKFA